MKKTTTNRMGVSMGRVPFWLRQKALVSRDIQTIRPGGYTLTHRAVEVCGFTAGDRILDAGCGFGMTLSYLFNRHQITATGLDRDRTVLERAAGKLSGDPQLVHSALPHLSFASGSFRGIFCECVLSLVHDPATCLKECHRVLAPNGCLVLSDLYLRQWAPEFRRRENPKTCAQGALPMMQMLTGIEAAGLTIDIIEDHTALLSQLGQMHPGFSENGARTGYTMIIARRT